MYELYDRAHSHEMSSWLEPHPVREIAREGLSPEMLSVLAIGFSLQVLGGRSDGNRWPLSGSNVNAMDAIEPPTTNLNDMGRGNEWIYDLLQ